jgi:antitoxin (DNA-binding transcriptional repressor) of toxin-antitoxin stability system
MRRVTTHEAKTHLSRLLAAAAQGEEIIICRGREPTARLGPAGVARERRRPRVGTKTSGPVRWAKDAFTPLDDETLSAWGL